MLVSNARLVAATSAGGISFWPQPTANAVRAQFPGNLSHTHTNTEKERETLAAPLEASTDHCGIIGGARGELFIGSASDTRQSLSSFLRRNASRGGAGRGEGGVAMVVERIPRQLPRSS